VHDGGPLGHELLRVLDELLLHLSPLGLVDDRRLLLRFLLGGGEDVHRAVLKLLDRDAL
jgi:hypothetical protein